VSEETLWDGATWLRDRNVRIMFVRHGWCHKLWIGVCCACESGVAPEMTSASLEFLVPFD
jgi:hypothetical protein